MQNALLVGLSRQVALARELDVVANNVANGTTTGFKARNSRFTEHLMPVARADGFQAPDQRLSYVIDAGTALDLSTGPIERTGNPLDVAHRGDAFFAVQTSAGERYTRAGAFQLSAAGQLVTMDGQAVLGENGPITLTPQDGPASISADGTVTTPAGERGRLKLVRFANPGSLRNEGANLFSSPTPPQPAGAEGRVESGALERSNVRPVVEMSRLIEVNRSYSTLATTVSRMDELRRTAIQRLADTQ